MEHLSSLLKRQTKLREERIFSVEERDGRLIVTRPSSSYAVEIVVAVLVSLLWSIGNWMIYLSPERRGHPIGQVILWMLVVPVFLAFSLQRTRKNHQAAVWVFDRNSGQVEHNGVAVFVLTDLKWVEVRVNDGEEASTYNLSITRRNKTRRGQTFYLTSFGTEAELQNVARQIADFTGARLNPAYW